WNVLSITVSYPVRTHMNEFGGKRLRPRPVPIARAVSCRTLPGSVDLAWNRDSAKLARPASQVSRTNYKCCLRNLINAPSHERASLRRQEGQRDRVHGVVQRDEIGAASRDGGFRKLAPSARSWRHAEPARSLNPPRTLD